MVYRDKLPHPGIESHRLEADGHRAHYLKAGRGSPVVLVHGSGSDCRDWTGVMAALSGCYSLYAPDLIGFGQSGRREEGYYLADFGDFILAFMDALQLDKPVLVGHSFGGRVCLDVAIRYPERVRKLVLVDSAGFGTISRAGHLLLTGFGALRRLLRRPQPFPKFLCREGEEKHWDTAPGLESISMPTLVIWKRHDPYLPLELARRAEALIPGARLAVLPGYGHAPHGQDTETFNRLLLDFFDGD